MAEAKELTRGNSNSYPPPKRVLEEREKWLKGFLLKGYRAAKVRTDLLYFQQEAVLVRVVHSTLRGYSKWSAVEQIVRLNFRIAEKTTLTNKQLTGWELEDIFIYGCLEQLIPLMNR